MVFRKFEGRTFENLDWSLIVAALLISAAGLVVLYSAGFQTELGMSPPMERQMANLGVGFVAFFFCMLIKTDVWYRLSYLIYFLSCGLLILVLFMGDAAGGAARWLQFGPVRVQPSEFTKFALIITLARVLSSPTAPRNGYNFVKLIYPAIIIFIPFELVRMQPDLGTALGHFLIAATMVFVVGVQRKTFVRLAALGIALLLPLWTILKDYQRQRILTFMSPEEDPLGAGYHAIQSKIAVGSGMLTGKGFFQGTQTQLRFLPEQTTDFIFSVLAEEWGFVGTVVLLSLYSFLIYRIFKIAQRCHEPFPAFVCVGVAALIFWQIVVNMGMVTGIMPVVGLTLPLLSFGGSSVLTVLASLGVVAGFSMRRYGFR